jgi:hypothetical protein
VGQTAYPCQEAGDTIFAYLGPGDAPLLPNYHIFAAAPKRVVETRVYTECNYLQGNEANIDPSHTSYVHRSVEEVAKEEDGEKGATQILYHFQKHVCPDLEIEETRFGLRIYATRDQGDGTKHLRITNFVMPNLCAIGGRDLEWGAGGYHIHWHVPIDDTSHWRWEWIFHSQADMDTDIIRQEFAEERTPDNRHIRNQSNRYLQDRAEMKSKTFAGVGPNFPVQDANVTETMGAIQDRAAEHLGSTDVAIAAQRRLLFQAIEEIEQGNDPLHVLRNAKDNDFADLLVLTKVVDSETDIKTHCRELVREDFYA